jgi:hypothetical protein
MLVASWFSADTLLVQSWFMVGLLRGTLQVRCWSESGAWLALAWFAIGSGWVSSWLLIGSMMVHGVPRCFIDGFPMDLLSLSLMCCDLSVCYF